MRIARLDYPKLDIKMYVSTQVEAAYRIRACAKEPWTVEWLESMPRGSVLYDVGANVGSYTLLAAALGHTVVAIEPGFANYARLCENILLNDLGGRVIPLCLAVADGVGVQLIQANSQAGMSGGTGRIQCLTTTLTLLEMDVRIPRATHVKVDVDGGEVAVLEGADRHGSWLVEVEQRNSGKVRGILGEPLRTWMERPPVQGLPPLKGYWYGLWEK